MIVVVVVAVVVVAMWSKSTQSARSLSLSPRTPSHPPCRLVGQRLEFSAVLYGLEVNEQDEGHYQHDNGRGWERGGRGHAVCVYVGVYVCLLSLCQRRHQVQWSVCVVCQCACARVCVGGWVGGWVWVCGCGSGCVCLCVVSV